VKAQAALLAGQKDQCRLLRTGTIQVMNRVCLGEMKHPPSRRAKAPTKVDLFVVEKKILVEAADLLDRRATHHDTGRGDVIDLSQLIVRVEVAGRRKQRASAGTAQ
jgi:hypothetical protein